MRKLILPVAVLMSAAVLLAAQDRTQAPAQAPAQPQSQTLQPLNVNPGLWQVTLNSTVNAAPAPVTTTYQSCVKQEDLAKYPFTDTKDKCTWTVQDSTGSKMDANGTCMPANQGKVTFTMHLEASDAQDAKGSGTLTMNGPYGAMNGNYSATAKWVSSTCPAALAGGSK